MCAYVFVSLCVRVCVYEGMHARTHIPVHSSKIFHWSI